MKKFRKIFLATIVLCLFSAFTILANAPVNADPNAGIPMSRSRSSVGTSFKATVPVMPPVKHMATLTANKDLSGTYLDLYNEGRYDTVSISQYNSTTLSPFVDIKKGTDGNWLGMYVGTYVPSGSSFDLVGYSNGVLSDTASGYWYYN